VHELPQIRNRIADTCYFQPYSIEDTWTILAGLHPHFATLQRDDPEHFSQVEGVHHASGGLPGLMVPFLDRLDHQAETLGEPITSRLVRVTQLLRNQDEHRAIEAARTGYRDSIPADDPIRTEGA